MASYAILRTQKLKSRGEVRRSLAHTYREQVTPNADPAEGRQNAFFGGEGVAEALAAFDALMPAKVRSNAVVCVEYLITASPEAMREKSREQQDAYLRDAFNWVVAKHGRENVFCGAVHRDETTPHLVCFVVPRDQRGKLNCRAFLGGGSHVMAELQTDFAESVGKLHGLDRGQANSKARHQEVRAWYAQIKPAATANNAAKARLEAATEQLVAEQLQLDKRARALQAKEAELAEQQTRLNTLADALSPDERSQAALRFGELLAARKKPPRP